MTTHNDSATRKEPSPQVSVIIPAYNVEPFIAQALGSVLSQTMTNLEVVVVDDGSTDNTGKIVEQVNDNRIRMIHKENGGCASARNAGVQAARGPWISFLDGDDTWFSSKLERELAFLDRHAHADLVFSLALTTDETGKNLGILKSHPYRSFSFEDLLIENPVGNGSSVTVRAETLNHVGPFDESLPASSDSDMWLRIARIRPDNILCLPEILTSYRRRKAQTTGNWNRMEKAHERVLDKARLIDPEAVQKVGRFSQCNKYRYHAFIAYEAGNLRMARRFMLKSLQAAPSIFITTQRSWVLVVGIVSKSCLPKRLHSVLEETYIRLRRGFSERKLRRTKHAHDLKGSTP